jgi:hypothetical protein
MRKVILFLIRIATPLLREVRVLREVREAEAFTTSMAGPAGARSATPLSEAAPHREKKKGYREEDLEAARAAKVAGVTAEKAEGNSCFVML